MFQQLRQSLPRGIKLPILAFVGLIFAVRAVISANQPVEPAAPIASPAVAPFASYVAGAGIVESANENIAIGAPVAGLVAKVFVEPGDKIKPGDPLFTIDDRTLQATKLTQESSLALATAKLARLKELPRPEDIPPVEARVREAEGSLAEAQNELARREKISDARAISDQELTQRRYAVQVASANAQEARAQLALLKAGSWGPDIAIAESEVAVATAQLQGTVIEIDRLTVRSPIEGEVLQIKVRAGEYAPAAALQTPLMLVGAVDTLQLRVDIDENDAWRIKAGAAAKASLRGNSAIATGLTFVRFEPYIIPKRSLTGESTERVDTRVLQILFQFPRAAIPVYVGQLMDVFIEAPTVTTLTGATSESEFRKVD